MCKKFFIAGVAVVLGLLVVKKTEVGSHLRAWWKDGKSFVKNSIPIENEIERLKGEIARLDDVHRTQFHPFAEESVAVDKLRTEIDEIVKKLEKQKADMDTMTNDLKSGVAYITYGDVKFPRARVEKDLARRFEAYKTCLNGLEAKKALLAAKEDKLNQAKIRLDKMKTARAEMEADLARLEADYEAIKVARVQNKFTIDDSALSRIKASMDELQDRVKVEKKKCELEGQFINEVNPRIEKAVEKRDLVKEIEDYFSKNEVNVGARINVEK